MDTQRIAMHWKLAGIKDVVDVGCGLGRHTVMLARMGFNASAFDLSQLAVEKTNAWLNEQGLKAAVVTADMLQMPYPDSSFDAMLATHVISHANSQTVKQALAEMHRVLRKDGEDYLTFTSKQSDDFRNDSFPHYKGDPNTRILYKEGPEYGVTHFYVSGPELGPLLDDMFEILKIDHLKTFHPLTDGSIDVEWHYHVLLRRR